MNEKIKMSNSIGKIVIGYSLIGIAAITYMEYRLAEGVVNGVKCGISKAKIEYETRRIKKLADEVNS